MAFLPFLKTVLGEMLAWAIVLTLMALVSVAQVTVLKVPSGKKKNYTSSSTISHCHLSLPPRPPSLSLSFLSHSLAYL